MRLATGLLIAIRALLRHKLRALLTMLGVAIGEAAVITLVTLGAGAGQAVQNDIARLGTNTLMIFPGTLNQGGVHSGGFGASTLTAEDAAAIGRECPAVARVAPGVQDEARVVHSGENWQTGVTGTTPDYFDVRGWHLASGRVFTADDVRTAAKVCVLGSIVAEQIFGDLDPVGATIRVQGIPMRVVGVLRSKGDAAFGGSQDDIVVVPYTTAMKRLFHLTQLRMILVQARGENEVDTAREQMQSLLVQRHRIQSGEAADFTIGTQAELARAAAGSTRTITLLLGAIASVSLLVGGIGIMNMMLVSVSERVREIGIRLAVGARSRDIQAQFLLEALVLSVVGGLGGIAVAGLLAQVATLLTNLSLAISFQVVALAVGVAVAIGVSSGFYPALLASRLDPIEALRCE